MKSGRSGLDIPPPVGRLLQRHQRLSQIQQKGGLPAGDRRSRRPDRFGTAVAFIGSHGAVESGPQRSLPLRQRNVPGLPRPSELVEQARRGGCGRDSAGRRPDFGDFAPEPPPSAGGRAPAEGLLVHPRLGARRSRPEGSRPPRESPESHRLSLRLRLYGGGVPASTRHLPAQPATGGPASWGPVGFFSARAGKLHRVNDGACRPKSRRAANSHSRPQIFGPPRIPPSQGLKADFLRPRESGKGTHPGRRLVDADRGLTSRQTRRTTRPSTLRRHFTRGTCFVRLNH